MTSLPSPESLEEVLAYALIYWDEFSLVIRSEFDYNDSINTFLDTLSPFLISKVLTSKWPGTELHSEKAEVFRFKVEEASIKILSTVEHIFNFLHPQYPEDLAFYKSGRATYASVAHEEMAWLEE